MRALLNSKKKMINTKDETGIRTESIKLTVDAEDMTTEKAKRIAKYYAIKEYRYMRDHTFDISLFVGTSAISGFTFLIISNL